MGRRNANGGGGGGGTTIIVLPSTDRLTFVAASAPLVLTNQLLAEQELSLGNINRRLPYVGTDYTLIRLTIAGAAIGAAASRLFLKYSDDDGETFTVIPLATLSMAALGTAVAPIDTGWIALPVGARIDGLMACFTDGGNGTADPSLTIVDTDLGGTDPPHRAARAAEPSVEDRLHQRRAGSSVRRWRRRRARHRVYRGGVEH